MNARRTRIFVLCENVIWKFIAKSIDIVKIRPCMNKTKFDRDDEIE